MDKSRRAGFSFVRMYNLSLLDFVEEANKKGAELRLVQTRKGTKIAMYIKNKKRKNGKSK